LLSKKYPLINGLTTKGEYVSLPATPTLLNKLGINSPKYLEAREAQLKEKHALNILDTRLRPYQNDGVNFIINSKLTGIAVFDEQRLGKTPTTLTALKLLNAKPIIVVPKSLLYQWYEEYKKWYDDDVILIDGTPDQRANLYKKQKPFIISYSTLTRDIDLILKQSKHYTHLIIDEAHRIRNAKKSRKAKPATATATIKLANHITYKIALTGTPSANMADDIFGILQFLYPDLFRSYYAFIEYYFELEDIYTKTSQGVKTITKATSQFKKGKQEEMLEFLDLISIQRKRKEVMTWLPQYNIDKITLPMDKQQIIANESLSNYFEYKNTVCLDSLSLMLAQRQLAMAPELLECKTPGCKFKYIKDYIDDYPDKSIIIVSTLVEPLLLLQNFLNLHTTIIIGQTSPKARNEIKHDFQLKKIRILLANLTVIKEGFTLDTADTIIFLESSYIYTDNLQCMDRLVPTAENRVHSNTQEIKLLIAQDSIDEYIYDMVYVKKASSSNIINNYKDYLERNKK
jgi:SNF2 family DNA or RNA helicase